VDHYRKRFTAVLERATGGVQSLAKQMEDWIRSRSGAAGDEDDEA
jgi:hypothetical protein